MRVVVVVPNALHKGTAGSRIRYDRLGSTGALEVVVRSLDELSADDLDGCKVLVLSKTYSVGAIAIACEARRRGKVVGFDLFDDYFSAADDARLTRFRTWLRRFGTTFDFALCSTSAMRRTIADFAPSLPILIVPDVFPPIDARLLAATLEARRQRAMDTKVLDIVWFGIGSNPFFPVGLHDLSAFAWSLDSIARTPFDLRLTVLTDDAAQTTGRLARLRRITIPHRIETWSIEAETKALEGALVAFIPVSGQSFSKAKSLNRALTAISAGAQVLSPGYPLYDDLGAAIYRDGEGIVPDLVADRLRIRTGTVEQVAARAAALSALPAIVSELYVFLIGQIRTNVRREIRGEATAGSGRPHALIISQDADREMVAINRRTGVLSVRGPFSRTERVFDIRLDHRGGRELDVWVRPDHVRLLAEPLRKRCSGPKTVGKVQMVQVETGVDGLLDHPLVADPGDARGVLSETVAFDGALADVERVCRRLFPGVQFLTSDIRAYMRPGCAPTLTSSRPDE